MTEGTDPEYNIYRGLQRPLELFGLKGPNILWAAGTAFGAFVAAMAGGSIGGFLVALVLTGAVLAFGGYHIWKKTKEGLHSKKRYKGTWVVTRLIDETA